MLDPETIAQRYLEIWNERDGARRKSLIGALWTRDASFVDPVAKGDGVDEIDAVIGGLQIRFPDFSFTQLGKADGFGDYVRLTWELGPQGGEAPIQGTDFAVIENNQLKSVTGFFDRLPPQ